MSEDFFDFGFTAVDEEELQTVQAATTAAKAIEDEYKSAQERLDKLYNAITPLLNNLKKNPERDYLHWPGDQRLAKVEEFEEHITKIYQG